MKDEELKRLDFSGWPLPDQYLIEIKRVSALWASLESLLNICLGKLAGFNDVNDPKPFILVNHSSFPQRLDMLGALCEQLAPDFPDLANYNSVIGVLRSAQKLRNTYMHHGMAKNPATGNLEMATGSARGKLSVKVEVVTVQDIRRATVAISEATRALYKLVLKRDIPPPWEGAKSA
jgi:hypothetical protein